MRNLLASLGIAISLGASHASMAAESERLSVSGCILIFQSNDTAAKGPGYKGQRLLVSTPLPPGRGFDFATHRGEATFTHLGKEWNIESEFSFRRLSDGFRYERDLWVSVNGAEALVPTVTHGDERIYQEGYFFPTAAGLKFLDLNEIVGDDRWAEVRSGAFSLFTICTPRFEEGSRADTIHM